MALFQDTFLDVLKPDQERDLYFTSQAAKKIHYRWTLFERTDYRNLEKHFELLHMLEKRQANPAYQVVTGSEYYLVRFDRLNRDQLESFLRVRDTFYKKKSLPQGTMSYLFLLCDTLINSATLSAQSCYFYLTRLWQAGLADYRTSSYFSKVCMDYALAHELPLVMPSSILTEYLKTGKITEENKRYLTWQLEQMRQSQSFSADLMTICLLGGQKPFGRKAYKEHLEKLEEVVPKAAQYADRLLYMETGNGLLDTYYPLPAKPVMMNQTITYHHKSKLLKIQPAVENPKRRRFRMPDNSYFRPVNEKNFFSQLERCCEREILSKSARPVLAKGFELLSQPLRQYIYDLAHDRIPDNPAQEQPAGITLDFQAIDTLREESRKVRQSLEVKNAAQQPLVVEDEKIQEFLQALLPVEKSTLVQLWKSEWNFETADQSILTLLLQQSIQTGTVSLNENGTLHPAWKGLEKYLPALKKELQHAGSLDEGEEFVQSLDESELQALLAISHHDMELLTNIADEQFTMPDLLVDGINEKALLTLKGVMIEQDGGEYRTADEYQHVLDSMERK